ncbi:MAG: cobaltochelatase subunit CobN, partial [Solirubrobacteraceae bacterium]
MLVLLTTADTDILAAAHATRELPEGFAGVRCANPAGVEDEGPFLDRLLAGAQVVVTRLLGGRRAWPVGLDELRRRGAADGVPLILLGGEAEPDAELAELSTAPTAVVGPGFWCLRQGGVEEKGQALCFPADTPLLWGQ